MLLTTPPRLFGLINWALHPQINDCAMCCCSIHEIHGCVEFWQYQTLLLWTPAWLSLVFTEPSAYPAGQQLLWSLRSWYIPFKLHNSPMSLHSPSLFLLTIFALHKLLPEWSSRFCIEEGSHRTNLPSCCFSLRLLLSLSLFSPGSVAPTLPGLHRLRTERAGKCYLRLILFSSPFLVSPHFLCLDYCLWGQRGFYLILCR